MIASVPVPVPVPVPNAPLPRYWERAAQLAQGWMAKAAPTPSPRTEPIALPLRDGCRGQSYAPGGWRQFLQEVEDSPGHTVRVVERVPRTPRRSRGKNDLHFCGVSSHSRQESWHRLQVGRPVWNCYPGFVSTRDKP